MHSPQKKLSGLATGEPDDPATKISRIERKVATNQAASNFGRQTVKPADALILKSFTEASIQRGHFFKNRVKFSVVRGV